MQGVRHLRRAGTVEASIYIYTPIYVYIASDTASPCNELCHRDSCANRDVHVCGSVCIYSHVYVTQ